MLLRLVGADGTGNTVTFPGAAVGVAALPRDVVEGEDVAAEGPEVHALKPDVNSTSPARRRLMAGLLRDGDIA